MASIAFPPDYARTGLFYVAYNNRRDSLVVARVQPQRRQPAGRGSEFGPLGPQHPGADPGTSRRPASPSARTATSTSAPATAAPAGDPARHAQNLDLLRGKLLRIDPTPRRRLHDPCRQPVRRQARPGRDLVLRPAEPAALLLRPPDDDIAIGDVGKNRYEEIDYLPIAKSRGANFGWPAFEGFAPFKGGLRASDTVLPAMAYRHRPGAPSTAATWSAIRSSRGSAAGRSSATTCSATTAPGSCTASAHGSGDGPASSEASGFSTRYLSSIGAGQPGAHLRAHRTGDQAGQPRAPSTGWCPSASRSRSSGAAPARGSGTP